MASDSIEIPVLDIEDRIMAPSTEDAVENTVKGSVNYAFIGSGQGGSRIAQEFYNLGYKKTLCVNTSPQDLKDVAIPENQKFLLDIGPGGAGKDLGKGEEAVVKYRQELYDRMRNIFGTNVESIMICASTGGGSGAGSVVPLIMLAKKYLKLLGYNLDVDKRVGVIMTLPTNGEAQSLQVASNAWRTADLISGLAESGHITPLVIVDNARIRDLFRGLKVTEYWPTVNSNIAGLFDVFNRLSIQHSPFTSFDPSDYKTVIQAGGHCILGVTVVREVKQETDISTAIKANMEKTLFAKGFSIDTAKFAAAAVVGSEKVFDETPGLQDAIDYGFDALSSMTGKATVHRGIYSDDRDVLRVYTILGGLKRPEARYNELKALASEVYP